MHIYILVIIHKTPIWWRTRSITMYDLKKKLPTRFVFKGVKLELWALNYREM